MLRSTATKVMAAGRFASAVFGLALILALVVGVASMALGANGGNFILGQNNTASLLTKLTGQVPGGAALQVVNTRPEAGSRGLQVSVAENRPPILVNATAGKATNLNADQLDGKDSTDFRTKYAQTVLVAKSGGDFTSVQAALGSITDASASKHYLVWVGPGTYNERVQMKPFVDIEGAGSWRPS